MGAPPMWLSPSPARCHQDLGPALCCLPFPMAGFPGHPVCHMLAVWGLETRYPVAMARLSSRAMLHGCRWCLSHPDPSLGAS